MEPMSPHQRIIAEETVCLVLVRGESPEGRPIFAYVAIRADNMEAFMAAQARGTFYPEDFGIVIESGSGEPTPDVRERMTRDYGFNLEAMADIADQDAAGSRPNPMPLNGVDLRPGRSFCDPRRNTAQDLDPGRS